jgi:chemotaxis protein MotB
MKQGFFLMIISTSLLASCGTSKKLETANAQITQLNGQVSQLNGQLSEKDKVIAELKEANEINSRDAADCRIVKENLKRKKETIDRELAARGTSLEELEAKAERSIRNLRAAGCDVEYSNGRFHISVPDEFAFASGSKEVGPRRREALNVVAQVMYDNPGVTATIVGHTDTIPVKGDPDNWSLSTERANAIVRVLADVYNINPNRLIAAGRSKFNPIAKNDTPEGRTRNRRIEITINPYIDKLLEMAQE